MAKVEVWNDNTHVYAEKFNGDMITIPAKSYILMEYDQAVLFRSSFPSFGLKRLANGQQDPTTYKMIRIGLAVDGHVPIVVSGHACQACKYVAKNAADLDKHSAELHADAIVSDPQAELAAETEKRKPGRPKRSQAVTV